MMDKILFVCFGNVWRSQMAEAFYNYYTKSKGSFSAWTDPTTPQRYSWPTKKICKVMKEYNIDVSKQKVKFINQNFLKKANHVFVMCNKSECPSFLLKSDKVSYRKIKDPYKMWIDWIKKVRDQIKKKVISIIYLSNPIR